MQQQEFENLTGMTVDPIEYDRIEEIYLNAGSMDNETFCMDYAKGRGHKIMEALSSEVTDQRDNVRRLENERREKVNEMVDFLIAMHDQTKHEPLRKQAVEMVGRKQYILHKCHMALPLDDLEQAWVIELLE